MTTERPAPRRRLRVGVTLPLADSDTPDGTAPPFALTLDFARRAEAAGLEGVWIFDHLLFRFPDRPDGGMVEGWTTLAALAPLVPRVELGSLVMCSTFRAPGLMASMARTLDDLSGGRLILGLGAGWHDPEYEAFGYPTDHKVGRFAEDLEVTARLLRGERVTLQGRWRDHRDAVLVPAPSHRVPILVAAKGERMLGLTAAWADAWNTAWFGDPDDPRLATRMTGLDAACAAIGRDPGSIRRTIGVRLHEPGELGDDRFGTDAGAEGLADLFDGLAAAGADDVLIWSIAKTPAALERIGRARELHRSRAGA
jgi:alkanesulfonate monooxygenase SsuD/methylene tetrahydromethanopterin reductase-like flavin-dependent oxidoreductase (luciferase family)